MAVAAAETFQTCEVGDEEYARSMHTIRRLGQAAMAGEAGQSHEAIQQLAWVDFQTGVAEMLKTDPEFRERLDVDSSYEFGYSGGKVRAADGTSLVEITERGYEKSQLAAFAEPRLHTQVVRDLQDVENARKVDALQPGMSRIVLSMDPKAELQADKDLWERMGYREGIAYIQWYARTGENALQAGSYSVDMSDEATWRELFAELGVVVPADESPNTWIRHGLEQQAGAEETEQFVQVIRRRYYEKVTGSNCSKYSINEYLANNREILDQLFSVYYSALADAVASGRNNETMRAFADRLQYVSQMDAATKRQLIKTANSSSFDDNAGRAMDAVIRYAAVEELRKGLAAFTSGDAVERQAENMHIRVYQAPAVEVHPGMLNQMMFANVRVGVEEGRSYGGCSPVSMRDKDPYAPDWLRDPQDVYGGKEKPDQNEISTKKWMKCPHCSARVFGDPCAQKISCWDCSAKVKDGKVVSTGDGGRQARLARLRAAEASRKAKTRPSGRKGPGEVSRRSPQGRRRAKTVGAAALAA